MSAPTPRAYLMDDVCKALQISRSTLKRLRRAGTFPIPELPTLDRHPRWAADAVEAFLLKTRTVTRHPAQSRRIALVRQQEGGSR